VQGSRNAGFFTGAGVSLVCSSHSSCGFFSPAVVEVQLVRLSGFSVGLCSRLACLVVFVAPSAGVGLSLLWLLLGGLWPWLYRFLSGFP
jgi:hypothetical protein